VLAPAEWPAERLLGQLALQLELWHTWAIREAGRALAAALPRPARKPGRAQLPAG
jgi:hypothetical protein